jgi:ABC-type multidrug transport system fused ATPase/permease subunit
MPKFEHINSITTGLLTIRAFGRTRHYEEKVYDLLDQRTKIRWYLSLGMKWMNFCMGTIGTVFVNLVAITLSYKSADAALTGFTITLAMRLSKTMIQMVRGYGRVETALNAVDRITEYMDHPIETQAGYKTPIGWPSRGQIVVEALTVRFKGALALNNISFCVEPGQRVCIVGRTGAGKTTLAHSFLRFLEPEFGKVIIDGSVIE